MSSSLEQRLQRDLARLEKEHKAAPYKRVMTRELEARVERLFSQMDKNNDWALEKHECMASVGRDGMTMMADMDVSRFTLFNTQHLLPCILSRPPEKSDPTHNAVIMTHP